MSRPKITLEQLRKMLSTMTVQQIADRVGMAPATLYERMKKHGIKPPTHSGVVYRVVMGSGSSRRSSKPVRKASASRALRAPARGAAGRVAPKKGVRVGGKKKGRKCGPRPSVSSSGIVFPKITASVASKRAWMRSLLRVFGTPQAIAPALGISVPAVYGRLEEYKIRYKAPARHKDLGEPSTMAGKKRWLRGLLKEHGTATAVGRVLGVSNQAVCCRMKTYGLR